MKQWKTRLLHALLLIFVLVVFVAMYRYYKDSRYYSEKIELHENWTVKVNDDVYENVDLNDFRIPLTGKGDWLVLTTTIPENINGNASMRIHMIHSVTHIYVDGEQIYEYGMDDFEKELMIGYGTRFVSVPQDCGGKQLKITFFVTEDSAFSTITPPSIYDESNVFQTFVGERLLAFVISITLIVAGLSISLVTLCLYFKSYSMQRLFCIGVFAICVGCWSLCSYNLDLLFTNSLKVKSFLEYTSLYLVLFPLLLYFREDVEKRSRVFESFVYYALLIIEIQLFIITVTCHALNYFHLPVFVKMYHIFMGVVALFVIVLIIQGIVDEKSHKILLVGVSVLVVVALRDLAVFNLTKYVGFRGPEGEYQSFAAFGALFFVLTLLVDFIHEMKRQMYVSAETEFLIKIAYVDVLTDLNTRRKIEEVFETIDGKKYEYAIIQFDLNNLKHTNDTFGHEKGDELIVRFATILKNIFSGNETLGRMGGDEFITVIPDAYDYDVDAKLKALDEAIAKDNSCHEDVKVSVSYGYCKSAELEEPTAHSVYMAADRRMYAQKENYYKTNGKGRRKYDEA